MTLHSIVGMQNSGKSLIATFFCWIDYLKGRKILSNINLAFPHYLINIDFLYKLAIEQPVLRNVSFLIDESWIWFDSRHAMKGYKHIGQSVGTYFFLQSSKDNSNIYMTAQTNEQNEIRIQRNLHRLTKCQRVTKLNNKYTPVNIDERDLTNFRIISSDENKKILNVTKDVNINMGIPMNDVLFIHARNEKKDLNGFFHFKSNLYLHAKEYFKLYNTYEKRKIN